MKILIVNASDIGGGAARAANRLHKALIGEGIDSKMLVQSKKSDDDTVIGPESDINKGMALIRPSLDKLPFKLYKNRSKTPFSPGWLPFGGYVKKINSLKPDIVHLHWINGGMISIKELVKIKAPIVWSLHDNWAFTGGCHIMWECEKYKSSCGKCPVLGSNKVNDLSHKVFNKKKKTFKKIKNLNVVGLSTWLAECAKKSTLFKDQVVYCLPNPINTKDFSPVDKKNARLLLNLPINKKLIAFGALSATNNINKGYQELSQALQSLKTSDTELLVFGSSQPKENTEFTQKSHFFGRLHDNLTLRILYSAADVMIVPSKQEAFGQTASEAMACGTPVVAFGATGLLDIIDHKKNGYLAVPFDTYDLAQGIDWVLENSKSEKLSENAQDKVLKNFEMSLVAKKYISLYKTILNK